MGAFDDVRWPWSLSAVLIIAVIVLVILTVKVHKEKTELKEAVVSNQFTRIKFIDPVIFTHADFPIVVEGVSSLDDVGEVFSSTPNAATGTWKIYKQTLYMSEKKPEEFQRTNQATPNVLFVSKID